MTFTEIPFKKEAEHLTLGIGNQLPSCKDLNFGSKLQICLAAKVIKSCMMY